MIRWYPNFDLYPIIACWAVDPLRSADGTYDLKHMGYPTALLLIHQPKHDKHTNTGGACSFSDCSLLVSCARIDGAGNGAMGDPSKMLGYDAQVVLGQSLLQSS